MPMGAFFCETRITTDPAVRVVAALGAKRLLVVSDPFFRDTVAQQLGEASGAVTEYFSDVTPDPDLSLAAKGAAAVKDFSPDTVVALGGGSAMDCAKAMVYFSGLSPRLIAIPTTSGSGSEVTDFAILTHNGVKHPLVDEKLRPAVAIVDSELVKGLPKALVADGGFDALTHGLEAYTATNSTLFTDALAKEAFRHILGSLSASHQGDLAARQQVHQAASMAGLAFTRAGLGLCHGLSHALGGLLHLPHGRLNAILLPAVMQCNAPACGERYAALARDVGLEGRAVSVGVRNLMGALTRLRRQLGLPGTLTEAGASAQEVHSHRQALVEAVLADPCCNTNPRPVTAAMVAQVLDRVTGHG